jgi:hypothetical protein
VLNDPIGAFFSNPTWSSEQWDLTSYVNANLGATVTLDFEITVAETSSSQQTLAVGIDDVTFTTSTTAATPEPGDCVLTGSGCLAAALWRLRRRRQPTTCREREAVSPG